MIKEQGNRKYICPKCGSKNFEEEFITEDMGIIPMGILGSIYHYITCKRCGNRSG